MRKSKLRKLPDGSVEVRIPLTATARRQLDHRFDEIRNNLRNPRLDDGSCLGLLLLQQVIRETETEPIANRLRMQALEPANHSIDWNWVGRPLGNE